MALSKTSEESRDQNPKKLSYISFRRLLPPSPSLTSPSWLPNPSAASLLPGPVLKAAPSHILPAQWKALAGFLLICVWEGIMKALAGIWANSSSLEGKQLTL